MSGSTGGAVAGRRLLGAGALLLALAILMGAFGAHALKARLTPQALQTLQTGVHYQFFNALGLLALGAWLDLGRAPVAAVARAAWLILAGAVVFSGSLYALAFGAPAALGMATPVGGVGMIAGWSWVASAFLLRRGDCPGG